MGVWINGQYIPDSPNDKPAGGYHYGGMTGEQTNNGGPTGGGSWYTGYSGTQGGVGTPTGGGPTGNMPGTPGYAATSGAYQRSEQNFLDALAKLNQQYTGGQLGQFAAGQFQNPQGFSPEVIAAMKRQAGEIFAGNSADAMQALNAGAAARGFGQSMGLLHEQDALRASRAQDVANAYANVDINSEMAKQDNRRIMMQMYAALLGAEGNQNQYAAQLLANKQEPVIPGVTPGPEGDNPGGFKWLGPDGRQKPGTFPHTQADWEEYMRERMMWETYYGGKAA